MHTPFHASPPLSWCACYDGYDGVIPQRYHESLSNSLQEIAQQVPTHCRHDVMRRRISCHAPRTEQLICPGAVFFAVDEYQDFLLFESNFRCQVTSNVPPGTRLVRSIAMELRPCCCCPLEWAAWSASTRSVGMAAWAACPDFASRMRGMGGAGGKV